MKKDKTVLYTIIAVVLVYIIVVASLHLVLSFEKNTAMGYMKRNCELITDTHNTWYECGRE